MRIPELTLCTYASVARVVTNKAGGTRLLYAYFNYAYSVGAG